MATKTRRSKAKAERQKISAKKRAEEHSSGYVSTYLKLPEGTKTFKLRTGTSRIDIMPYIAGEGNPNAEEGSEFFERTFFVHRNVGQNDDTYICPRKTFKKPCPICEHRSKLGKDPDADEDLIKDLAPKERQLFNVRDKSAKAETDENQVWDISFHLFGKLLDSRIKPIEDDEDEDFDEDNQYFADPVDGRTLKVSAVEKSFNGSKPFAEVNSIDFKPRKEPYDEDIAKEGVCLDACLIDVDYAKLKAIFLQTSDEDDEDDDDDEKPKGKAKPKPKAKPGSKAKKPVDDDDDEDEDDDLPDDDDDDDDDDKPAPKGKGKPAPKGKASELKVGSKVSHKKLGECEVVHVGANGLLRLEDEDGELHRGIKSSDVKALSSDDDDDDDDDDDEDEKPTPKAKPKGKAKPGSKGKKPVDDDEDEDDDDDDLPDDDDDEDDDDEDEKPAPKGKGKPAPKGKAKPGSKAKKPVDDDDDEDEDDDVPFDDDDDDEDEDDKPAPKGKAKPKPKGKK